MSTKSINSKPQYYKAFPGVKKIPVVWIAVGLSLGLLSAWIVTRESNNDLANASSRKTGTISLELTSGDGNTKKFQQNEKAIAQAAISIRSAKSEQECAVAKQILKDALTKDYRMRIDGYAAYLNELELKIKAMRNRLDERRAVEAEMVKLRVEILSAEAADLGWPAMLPESNHNQSASGVVEVPAGEVPLRTAEEHVR